jgi:eukaryotic-like serine/threonine-protein kinase
LIGKLLGNRYEIIEKIGGGGMALVYKAKCHLLNRFVAVKILRGEFTSDEEFVKRFKRESQAAASLSHPNIVNIYDVGTDGEIYYIVMEYVKGKTLKQFIKEKGRLSADQTVEIAKQICLGLEHAHKNHIVHRDIKPHNILLTEDGIAKVTDFGIARAITSSTVTNTGNVMGSVHYFSPEQARGGYIDEKSDLYSLGIVMYEMITGKVPFEGESPISVALKHLQEDITPPSELGIEVPFFLERIINKTLQKNQSSRFNNATELLVDLNQWRKSASDAVEIGDIGNYSSDYSDSPTKKIAKINNMENDENKRTDEDQRDKKINKNKKSKPSKFMIFVAILSALLLITVAFGAYYVWNFANSFFNVAVVEVPSLTGESKDDAINLLREKNLKYDIIDEYNNSVEQGIVFSQVPESGLKVKENSVITIRVSKGNEVIEMPDLNEILARGSDIKIELEKIGLVQGQIDYDYSEQPKNTVIQQTPKAGTITRTGSVVTYVISHGPKINEVTVPRFVGMQLSEVISLMRELNLNTGEIKNVRLANFPPGAVVAQSVIPGTVVNPEHVINFDVNINDQSNQSGTFPRKVKLSIGLNGTRSQFVVKIIKKPFSENEEVVYENRHSRNDVDLELEYDITKPTTFFVYFDTDLVDTPRFD